MLQNFTWWLKPEQLPPWFCTTSLLLILNCFPPPQVTWHLVQLSQLDHIQFTETIRLVNNRLGHGPQQWFMARLTQIIQGFLHNTQGKDNYRYGWNAPTLIIEIMNDRNYYFGLGLIPKPKPWLLWPIGVFLESGDDSIGSYREGGTQKRRSVVTY